jgi:hypothetical protein
MSTSAVVPVTIANGQTVSTAADISEKIVTGIEMPAAFTGTALTFQVASDSAGTFQILTKIDGTNYSVTVAAAKNVNIPALDLAGWRFVKIVSGSAEGADRVINLMCRTF